MPPTPRRDDDGNLRLLYPAASFADRAAVALTEIIESGAIGSVVVSHVLQNIGVPARQCDAWQYRLGSWRHAKRCTAGGSHHASTGEFGAEIQDTIDEVRRLRICRQ